jgi:streptogrisin C
MGITLDESAFTLVDNRYWPIDYGFVTAGHCGNELSYLGHSLAFQAEKTLGNRDVQWHKATGFSVKPRFYVSASHSWRSVHGSAYAVVGQQVCHYGPVTQYGCGTVDTINMSLSWLPGSYGFVRVYNCSQDLAKPGDSGSPTFSGNTAYGIHQLVSGAGLQLSRAQHDDLRQDKTGARHLEP